MEDGMPAELGTNPGLSKRSKKRILARRTAHIRDEFKILHKQNNESQHSVKIASLDYTFPELSNESEHTTYTDNRISVNVSSSSHCVASDPLDSPIKDTNSVRGEDLMDINSSLIMWSKKHNISHYALNDLLKTLKCFHPTLPKDARTLLETPQYVNIKNSAGGAFVYFGLETHLIQIASKGITTKNYPLLQRRISQTNANPFLSVSVNIDGLPIFSSSTNSFWPILCILDQSIDRKPFIVALYYGESKPNNADIFLRPFVEECLHLEQNGLYINGVKFDFRISCIIADAPARSFIKSIKSHNSLHACEKCQQEGIFMGRTIWPYTAELIPRTDLGFVKQEYDDHQLSKSLLTELEVGLVTQVPLDFMHLVCLGVVKKIIRCWVESGPKKCKLDSRKINEISRRLQVCRNHYPVEFSRRPRPLKLFKYWKATEFRAFLLYLGPNVLQNIWPGSSLYKHFLMLHCSVYILCNDICHDDVWRSYANNLLHCFVQHVPIFYSKEFLVYNVHNLLHLAGDVYNFGPLDSFSAFPFENFMSKIKRLVRSHNLPLEQVAKRLGEKTNLDMSTVPRKTKVQYKGDIIKKIPFGDNCTLSTTPGDSCFVTFKGDVVVVKSIESCSEPNSYNLKCDCFLNKTDFYKEPIESSKLGIYKVSGTMRINVKSSDLYKKCLLLPNFGVDDGTFICIPFVSLTLHH